MKIHISESTKSFLEKKAYKIEERGKIEIKGKGEMKTYFVLSRFDKRGVEVKCTLMEVFEDMNVKADHSEEIKVDKQNQIETTNNADTEDVKSIASRGYSPITMEDVKKSMSSLKGRSQVNILSPLPLLDDIPQNSEESKPQTSKKFNNNSNQNNNHKYDNTEKPMNKAFNQKKEATDFDGKHLHHEMTNSVNSNTTGNSSLGTAIVKRAEMNENRVKNAPSTSQNNSSSSLNNKANTLNTQPIIESRKLYNVYNGIKPEQLEYYNFPTRLDNKEDQPITSVDRNTNQATNNSNLSKDSNYTNNNKNSNFTVSPRNETTNSTNTSTNVPKKKFSFKSLLCQII